MEKYFDFVCISLSSRQNDRYKSSCELFEKLGILNQINWWIVDKHPSGGVYGCFESHVSVWNSPKFTKPFLCIFEDDLDFNEVDGSESKFIESLQYAQANMPHNFDLLNLEPQLGFIHEKLASFKQIIPYSGNFINASAYIIHRSTLPLLTSKVFPWYGMNIDLALYKNCRMVGIFPPIFKQKGFSSDIAGDNFMSLRKFCRKIIASSSWIGWFTLEMVQLKSLYTIYRLPPQEFKDRRCISDS